MTRPPAPWRAALVAGCAGLLLSALAGGWQWHHNQSVAEEEFDAAVQRTQRQLLRRLDSYALGLRGLRGAVLAFGAGQFDRTAFDRYSRSRDIDAEFPGARGMGLIRRVPAADEAAFVARARADGAPGFAVQQLHAHAGERWVIQYVAPLERNRAAVGLDIASEPHRRAAAEAAMRSGRAVLSAPITIVQAGGAGARSFLLLLPLYRDGAVPAEPAGRAEATLGWTYAPLVIDEVLAGVDLHDGRLALALQDGGTDAAEAFFASPGAAAPAAAGLMATRSLEVHGRAWRAAYRATPAFLKQLNLTPPAAVAGAGAAASLLLAALAALLARQAQQRAQTVADRTRHAAIVAASSDAIIGLAPDGRVTDWNAGAERLFGASADAAIGVPLADWLLPPDRAAEVAAMHAALARGDTVGPHDTQFRHRDGRLVDVSLLATPIPGPQGAGYALTLRDIGLAKAAERRVQQAHDQLEALVQERTAQLETARRDLRAILDAVPAVIGYWDHRLRNRFANRAYRDWFGADPDTLPGTHVREVLGDALYEQALPRLADALGGRPQVFDRTLPRRDGPGLRHTQTHYLPDVVDGRTRGFYALVLDITPQVEAQQRLGAALRENEMFLRAIRTHTIFSVADRSGRIVDVNEGFCAISGYTREELIGRDHRIVNSGHHPRSFWQGMWRSVAAGRPWQGEVCNRGKDGTPYWVNSIIAPFTGDDGTVERYISIRTDITARKRAEQELLATDALLRSVLDAASEVSIIATRPDMTISVFNRGAERMLGWRAEEVVGRTKAGVLHDRAEVEARSAQLAQRLGRPVRRSEVFSDPSLIGQPTEWTYLGRDGRRVPVSLIVTAMHDDHGGLLGYLGVAHDVTLQRAAQESLREARERAEQASRAKSLFLASTSHEIRTPLNAVIGLTYLLAQTPLQPAQAALLQKIRLAGRSLLALIDDVLDLSKIEAGELQVECIPFGLHQLVDELAALFGPQAEHKGLAFATELAPGLPAAVEGDPARLRQILLNLLSNALKFTERGRIVLRATPWRGSDGAEHLCFEVEDSGIGIDAAAQARLFEPFTQADDSTARRFGGTGLGLSIVRRLAGLMGGEVALKSEPGRGSVFRVDLPLRRAQPGALPDPAGDPLRRLDGFLVLVADDSEVNRDVAAGILRRAGAEVETLADGAQVLQRVAGPGRRVDLVLMDLQMPGLDGYATSRRLRAAPQADGLPILAFTAAALSSERERARAAGMDDFIVKPVEPRRLIRIVGQHLGATGAPLHDSDAAPLSPADDWPRIDGIDGAEARERLVGNLDLFAGMLRRLLDEFAGAADPILDAPACHKLRGAAATLGARRLARLAGEVEAVRRDAARGGPGADDGPLRAELADLRAASAAFLEHWEHRRRERQAGAADETLDAQDLPHLMRLLRSQSLAASELFARLGPALQGRLGDAAFRQLERCIDDLRFGDALELLSCPLG